MSVERRFVAQDEARVTLEEREGEKPKLTGYAAVYYDRNDPGTEYELWPGVRERIMPGAFDRAVAEGDDVRVLVNHDPNLLLGRTKAGTASLKSFSKGLRYSCDPPDTQVGRDTQTSIKRGDMTGSSFSFQVTEESWTREGDYDIREVRGTKLFDVGPVTFPAYNSATTGVRATGDVVEARSSHDAWKAAQDAKAAEEQRKVDVAAKLEAYKKRAEEVAG